MIFFRYLVSPLIFFTLVGLSMVIGYRVWYVHELQSQSFKDQPIMFSLEQPSQAKTIVVESVVGPVLKKSRQNEMIPLTSGSLLMQGETLQTDATSAAKLILPVGTLEVGSNSSLGTIDLIPSEFTLSHEKGEMIYFSSDAQNPITIRALHTLIKVSGGMVHLKVDPSLNRIMVASASGEVTMVYQDKDHKNFVVVLPLQPKAYYDDAKRLIVKPKTVIPQVTKKKK